MYAFGIPNLVSPAANVAFRPQTRTCRTAKPCRYVTNFTHCVLRTCARSSPTAGNKKTDTPALGVCLLRRISGREVKRHELSPRCFARRNRAAMLRTPRTACFALVREVLQPQSAKRAIHHFGCMALFGAPAENRTPDTLIKSQVLYQLSYRGI